MNLGSFIIFFSKAKTVAQPLSSFNNTGNRILSRTMLPQKNSLFYKLGAPFGTHSAEKLVVEKNFGELSTEIITFRNSKGNVIGRLHKNFNQEKLESSVDTRYVLKRNGRNDDEKLTYTIADIQRQFFNADKELVKMERKKLETALYDKNPNERHLTEMTYLAEKNNKEIFDGLFSISHKISGKTKKQLCLNLQHSQDGIELSQNITKKLNTANDILADPYLIARAMPDEFRIKNLIESLKQRVGLENKKIDLFYIKGDDINYFLGMAYPDIKQLGVAILPAMSETIGTIAHELRHFKQNELAEKFFKQFLYKITHNSKFNPHEYKLAKHFKKQNLYKNPFLVTENSSQFMKKWYLAGKEANAFRYEKRFKTEFDRYSVRLGEEFPETSEHFLGIGDIEEYMRFIA